MSGLRGCCLVVLLCAASAAVRAEPPSSVAPIVGSPGAAGIHVVAVGDVGFRRGVGRSVAAGSGEPFADVSAVISAASLAFCNLETVLSMRAVPDPTTTRKDWPIVRGPPQGADALARAGFDVVSVANNHVFDLYAGGFFDTLKNLSRVGITAVGGGVSEKQALKPHFKTVNGVRVGFLALASGTNRAAHGEAYVARRWGPAPIAAVQAMRGEADVVLVSLHWGNEGESQPNQKQRQLARALIDAGADVIIGHHPHVLQSVEIYRERPVIYSLGNFMFGKQIKVRRQSAILHLDLERRPNPVRRVALQAVLIDEESEQPTLARGAEAAEIYARIQKISRPFATPFTERDGLLELSLPTAPRHAQRD